MIEVRGAGQGGVTKTVRVAVARGTLPIRRASVTLFGDIRAELGAVGSLLGSNRDELPVLGFVHYRLLDQSGKRLFDGIVPGTSQHTYHPDVGLSVPASQADQLVPSQRSFVMPAISGAIAIEFTDSFGTFLGRGALP